MNNIPLRTRILLTLQSALLGMVTRNMQAVLVSWDDTNVHIRVMFDRMPNPADIELASEIETEVISHLSEFSVTCGAHVCPTAERIQPGPTEVFVFQRARQA